MPSALNQAVALRVVDHVQPDHGGVARRVQIGPAIGFLAQLALLAALGETVGLSALGWLVGIGCGMLTNATLAGGLTRHGFDRLGPADRVTLARAVLTGGVAALGVAPLGRPAALVALAGVALVLDAVDGRVARLTGTVSRLGARFDMEVDALLILVLSAYVARSAGPWVLAIGVARYAFVASGWTLRWLRASVPPRYWCKVVAAIQGIALTFAASNVAPRLATAAVLMVALALLAESFGREVCWLRRHRQAATARVAIAPVTALTRELARAA